MKRHLPLKYHDELRQGNVLLRMLESEIVSVVSRRLCSLSSVVTPHYQDCGDCKTLNCRHMIDTADTAVWHWVLEVIAADMWLVSWTVVMRITQPMPIISKIGWAYSWTRVRFCHNPELTWSEEIFRD